MSCCEFQSEIPWSCIRDMVTMIRTGRAISERWVFLQELSCLGGCIAKMQQEQKIGFFAATQTTLSADEVMDELLALADADIAGFCDGGVLQLLMQFFRYCVNHFFEVEV